MRTVISWAVELVIVVILAVVILGSLNYFGLVPISQTIPFLSFLPSKNSQLSATPNMLQIVSPNNTFQQQNSGKGFALNAIPNSGIFVKKDLQIDINVSAKFSSSNGSADYLFTNGSDSLMLFYFKPHNGWALGIQHKYNTTYFQEFYSTASENISHFTITISEDGKSIAVYSPEKKLKVYTFPDSLFTQSKLFSSQVSISPGSTITISSLSYQF